MLAKTEEEKRIAREKRQQTIAQNAALREQDEKQREARADKRFEETRDHFRRNVAYWNGTKDQPAKSQTLRIHRDALHKRLLWSEGDALHWSRRNDGTYYLNKQEIDSLQKPMFLLLQFVKAEHKLTHDRATLALRKQQIAARTAKMPGAKTEEENCESAERPLTPELSV